MLNTHACKSHFDSSGRRFDIQARAYSWNVIQLVSQSKQCIIKPWNLTGVATIEAWRGGSLVNCKSNYACRENENPPKNSSEKPQDCWCLRLEEF
ncbi:hypothetical protein DAPPUDRAFT_320064 [Daphnia pulex]|uniref:Uncharacterized protein n=1 Tax=Daphnia pulex TaxID=6669 RepID=E9GNQ7_DAPPU|nr:hypothetical protein DAPPUDRAFT_320064 [Daphnia pulex]|eukprot:EFX78914.1 hypothetical protein DAPPUDRAFT_320064 [Daphnia pulex]